MGTVGYASLADEAAWQVGNPCPHGYRRKDAGQMCSGTAAAARGHRDGRASDVAATANPSGGTYTGRRQIAEHLCRESSEK